MATAGFIALFLVLGVGVLFVAFSGGPGQAREAYLTGGRRTFVIAIVLLYIAAGVTIPAVVIADRDEGSGHSQRLASVEGTKRLEDGKDLFRSTCASCHNLDAVNARGVTGPDLDTLTLERDGVLAAIENGGTIDPENQPRGSGRMPAGLLQGADAEKVAEYVAAVAGK
jgi:mono/diheme cytochrome c family protein